MIPGGVSHSDVPPLSFSNRSNAVFIISSCNLVLVSIAEPDDTVYSLPEIKFRSMIRWNYFLNSIPKVKNFSHAHAAHHAGSVIKGPLKAWRMMQKKRLMKSYTELE